MHIVRNLNTPKQAITLNGILVHREEKIFVKEMGAFIPCAMYGNHFIYSTNETKKGTSPFMCTCGSLAVIVGSNVYAQDASASGALFVCHHHASFGIHADNTK